MKATVTYNDDGEPATFTVNFDRTEILRGCMDGGTAVITVFKPRAGQEEVYADDVHAAMDYLESLPFVQAVTLDAYEEVEE